MSEREGARQLFDMTSLVVVILTAVVVFLLAVIIVGLALVVRV